jgi:hypothetical protein
MSGYAVELRTGTHKHHQPEQIGEDRPHTNYPGARLVCVLLYCPSGSLGVADDRVPKVSKGSVASMWLQSTARHHGLELWESQQLVSVSNMRASRPFRVSKHGQSADSVPTALGEHSPLITRTRKTGIEHIDYVSIGEATYVLVVHLTFARQ